MKSKSYIWLLVVLGSLVLPPAVTPAGAAAPAVTSLTLINADTQQPMGRLEQHGTLHLEDLPTRRLSVRADIAPGEVGSVRFALNNDANYHLENWAPYSLTGDENEKYHPWTPELGNLTISATAYSEPNGKGTAAPTYTVTLRVVDETGPFLPSGQRMYGVLFGDERYLNSDWDAGIRLRELELSWWRHEPKDGEWDESYVKWKREEIAAARAKGYKIVLDLGLQYPPEWARRIRPMRDQYGNTYDRHVNAVWSQQVRDEIATYIQRAFKDFGTDFYGVRVGSGGWIETMYPPTPSGFEHSYWAFDSDAMKRNPVPSWRPGQASPNDEARRFYTWYVDSLSGVVNWQHSIIRRYYGGKLLQLFAGIGVRPEGWEPLIEDNLIPGSKRLGVDAAARGVVIDRIVGSIKDKRNVVLLSCSLGDSSASAWWLDEDSSDRLKWSSSHWAADVARRHGLPVWGENGGYDDYATMQLVFEQMEQFDYQALLWAFGRQLYEGDYASIKNYKQLIEQYR